MSAIPDIILSSHLRDIPHIAAFDAAMRDALAGIDVGVELVHLTEQVPASALDHLTEQWGLNGEGYNIVSAPEATKRKLLRDAPLLKSRQGTPWAIRYVFDVSGMPDIEIVEAAELNAPMYRDGTYLHSGSRTHGSTVLWAQYEIWIHLNTSTITVTDAFLDQLDYVLKKWAPARCRRVGVFVSLAEMLEELVVSDSLGITVV